MHRPPPNRQPVLRLEGAPPSTFAEALGCQRPELIGIGGAGMSALAGLLADEGLRVTGTDATPSPVTDRLAQAGITIGFDQTTGAIPEDADTVIASAAIRPDHPQILEAEHRGLPVLTYAEALGRCQSARTAICLAGTHGKSTTASMLGCALTDAGLDPAAIVGASCSQLAHGALANSPTPGGSRLGSAKIPQGSLAGNPGLLIAESCEFNRSFHHHRPTIASIANVEADHLDIYGSLDAVVEAFAEFARLIPAEADGGRLLIGHDGAHRREIASGLDCRVETIGYAPAADWRVGYDEQTRRVTLEGPDTTSAAWTLAMPGEHNAYNSAVAAALAIISGAEPRIVGDSLSAFRGVDRRLQKLGERPHPSGGVVTVYDDYGHHPTEIDATLRALRRFEQPESRNGRLVVVVCRPEQRSKAASRTSRLAWVSTLETTIGK
ncbi:MAG: Mur ligase domain-containing protein, partial [Planctomycetota bacterium]